MFPDRAQTTLSYRFVAIGFGAVSLVILGVVVSQGLTRAAVHVTLVPKPVETSFSMTVGPEPSGERAIAGRALATTVTGTKVITASGAGTVPAKARGTITITNNSSSAQPLAVTTRLLSSEGILFRTLSRVDVPAGASRAVEVEADQAGIEGEVGPGRFTLPGLRATNQLIIYGESTEAMTGGTTTSADITESDRTSARTELLTQLRTEALTKLEETVRATGGELTLTLVDETDTPLTTGNSQVGLRLTVEAVAYDKDDVQKLAERELQNTITEQEAIDQLDESSLTLTLTSHTPETQSAIVSVAARGQAVLVDSHEALQPEYYTAQSAADAIAKAEQIEGIETVTIRLTPVWARRTPRQSSRIQLTSTTTATP